MSNETFVEPDAVDSPEEEQRRVRERLEALKAREATQERARELLATMAAATRGSDVQITTKDSARAARSHGNGAPALVPWQPIGIGVLLVALGVGGWVFYPERLPPPLTPADFSGLDRVSDVMARPPDVYLTVGLDDWKRMPDSERQQLVQQAVLAAEPQGYKSLHVLTDDGGLAAQWIEGGQVRIF